MPLGSEALELEARLKDHITGEMSSIIGALGQYDSKYNTVAKNNVKASDEMSRAARDLKESWNLGKIALGSFVGAFGAMSIVNKTTAFLKSARAEYQEAQVAQLKLEQALGFTSAALKEQANILSEKLIIDDDDVTKVQAKIAIYTKNEEQIKALSKAAFDFAAVTGGDATSAAMLLGKAVGGSTEALSRYGIKIDKTNTSMSLFDQLMLQLNKKFAGQAESAAQAKDGWDSFGVSMKQVAEAIGRSNVLQGAGTVFADWGKGVKIITESVFKETVRVSQNAAATLTEISDQASGIVGVWEGKEKVLAQLAMRSHIDRVALYKKQAAEMTEEAKKAGDAMAVYYIQRLYYGPNGIITQEEKAERDRAAKARKAEQERVMALVNKYGPGQKEFDAQQAEAQEDEVNRINKLIARENEAARFRQSEAGRRIREKDKEAKKDEKDDKDKFTRAQNNAEYIIGSFSTIAQAAKANSAVMKGLDIAQATANTAIAVTESLTTPWMIPFIIAQGMAQVAIISSQKYAGGGIVGGGSSTQGDVVPAMLTPGEMVLNAGQQASLFNLLQPASVSNVSNRTVSNNQAIHLNINVGSGGNYDMAAARLTVDSLVPVIGDALVRAKNDNRLRDYEAMR